MVGIFSKNNDLTTNTDSEVSPGFEYLDGANGYFDSACQTLRPKPVVEALEEYYYHYNACGGRVKYAWGKRVDEELAFTRQKVLKLVGKKESDYWCSFGLNTTYGLNLIMTQLNGGDFKKVVTSDIEHNSVYLPTIELTKRLNIDRVVLSRANDGSLKYKRADLTQAIVVVNTTSNIDGRNLVNLAKLSADVKHARGLLILDGAQTMGHDSSLLKGVEFDALCFSGHKMYGPSLGVVVAKKTLADKLDFGFIGGGMVEDVTKNDYKLTSGDLPSRLEPGLQDFGGIIALSRAIDWRNEWRSSAGETANQYEKALADKLFLGLKQIDGLDVFNHQPSTVISFSSNKVDAHRIATVMSQQNFMARSGYFCCHYYLHHKLNLPPLLRISLGLNNTPDQIDKLLDLFKKMQRSA